MYCLFNLFYKFSILWQGFKLIVKKTSTEKTQKQPTVYSPLNDSCCVLLKGALRQFSRNQIVLFSV